jgi:uncharacterized protein
MEFFVYGRDRPDVGTLRMELTEAHWAYMDGYEGRLIARGPTLTADRESATGSVHVVDVADPAAARRFAHEDPYYRAGVFADVLVRRWHNDVGRTMWQFERELGDEQRFLVLGDGDGTDPADPGVIVAGPLLSDDGTRRLGSMALVQRPSLDAVLRAYPGAEVHNWEFGGRR